MSRAVDSTARAMAGEALSRLDNGGSGSGGTTVDAYSKLETDNLLNAKVDDIEFTPIKALAESNEINITYLANNKAEKTEVNALSELVADIDSEVDLKANASDVYTKSETNTAISDKVAEIVANAPEDFDTLKELADWIDSHEDSASAMNTAIKQNTSDIATLKATDESTATEIAVLQEQITEIQSDITDTRWVAIDNPDTSVYSSWKCAYRKFGALVNLHIFAQLAVDKSFDAKGVYKILSLPSNMIPQPANTDATRRTIGYIYSSASSRDVVPILINDIGEVTISSSSSNSILSANNSIYGDIMYMI